MDALGKLRKSWLVYASVLIGLLISGFAFLSHFWQPIFAGYWLVVSGVVLGYQLRVLWRGLESNHRRGETELLPELGAGNVASLARGAMIGALYGFIFLPRPPGWLSWIPGVLYTIAVLVDFLDGYLARRTNHVTRLGEILDMHLDGLGMLAATALIVLYQQVPWWYLLIGLARYLFLIGIAIRKRLSLPIHDLPPSNRRRGLAGLQMGFVFVMLWPLFSPPGTKIVAIAFGLPLLISFLFDWLILVGLLPMNIGSHFPAWKDFILQKLPLAFRLAAVILIAGQSYSRWQDGDSLDLLFFSQAGVGLSFALGGLGRSAAILGVILLGFQQMSLPLSVSQYLLAFVYVGLLILGTGSYSLWKPEDSLLFRRAGERSLPGAGKKS
jgi:CDP-diacylglycerol--glycerol-3-phosphate 3-phosphatidyltransferase